MRGWWIVAAAVVLAGCSGPVEEGTETPQSRANEKVIDDDRDGDAEPDQTTGRVTGTVLSEAGLPIQGALVVILSIDTSVTTDAEGLFAFDAVEEGEQTLRVEKENYKTLLESLTAVAGKRVDLEVVLVPVDGVDPGDLDHFHNHWRGQDRYTVFDGTVEWETERDDEDPLVCQNQVYGSVPLNDRGCFYLDIIPEEERIVPPGTKTLEITVEFENPYGNPPRFYMDPPDYECDIGEYCYNLQTWNMESGQTHVLELDPLWTDHGHASNTGWAFYIYWHNSINVADAWTVNAPVSGYFWNDLMKSPVDIKIEAVKGVLEVDPPHPRFWQDNDTIALEDTAQYLLCLTCTQYERSPIVQTRYDCAGHCILMEPGHIIPPGATRLDFTFQVTWQSRNEVDDATYDVWAKRFMIGYKTPDVGLKHGTWDDFVWPEPVEVDDPPYGQKARFRIDLDPEHSDAWYDTFSQWMFSIAPEGEPEAEFNEVTCPYTACPYPWITLSDIRVTNDRVGQPAEGQASEGED